MSQSLLTPEALASVGQEKPLRYGVISAADIAKYCAAVDDANPLYHDRAAARAAGHADIIAPPLFPFAATRPSPKLDRLLDDGQFDDLAPPGMQHLQSMAASQEFEIYRPAVVGEQVIERVKFGSMDEKEGRNGNMVFVAEEGLVTTPDGDPICKTVNRIMFRPAPPPAAPFTGGGGVSPVRRPVTSLDGQVLTKRPSMISLFMFAAAIWAVHRIHYDVPYAQSEGLPGPILPGWMMAQFMTEFAALQNRGAVRHLSVRYQALVFAGDELAVRVVEDAGEAGLKLAVTNQAGVDVVSGTVRFA